MNFFTLLHKSIFDRDFYREAAQGTWKRGAAFLLKLLLFTTLILCVSKTYYLTHAERGIAPIVSVLFDGLEIRSGRLVVVDGEIINDKIVSNDMSDNNGAMTVNDKIVNAEMSDNNIVTNDGEIISNNMSDNNGAMTADDKIVNAEMADNNLATNDGEIISNDKSTLDTDMPRGLSGVVLTELMNRLMGSPRFFSTLPDDFMIVDTRYPPVAAAGAGIVMRETAVEFPEMRMVVPYAAFVGAGDFTFSKAAAQEFLNRNVPAFAVSFFLTSLVTSAVSMALIVLFLALAAYMFRLDRTVAFKRFARFAVYAVSPVMLGDALVSITGVAVEWTWHAFIVLSTLLMYRTMSRAAADNGSSLRA